MNCQEFEQVINDLTDTAALDAVKREAATDHAANCNNCETRLANLQSLHAGMKALATATVGKEVSPRVEVALLAAFRQQTATPSTAIATTADNVVGFPVVKKRAMFLALAAAILLVIFAVTTLQRSKEQPVNHQETALAPSPSPTAPSDLNLVEEKTLTNNGSKPVRTIEKRIKRQFAKSQAENSTKDYIVTASLSEFTAITGNSFSRAEITTDFLPLTFESSAQPIESGQVIRVEMPRRAMTSFGLPINLEKADEPVTADVLLAEDGSTRAIRFVR